MHGMRFCHQSFLPRLISRASVLPCLSRVNSAQVAVCSLHCSSQLSLALNNTFGRSDRTHTTDMSSSEEDLQLALELSMQGSPSNVCPRIGSQSEAIDLTSDTEDEDDDIRRAIALSLQQTEPTSRGDSSVDTPNDRSNKVQQPPPLPIIPAVAPSTALPPTGISGIDRRTMEQERLARLGKRKRISTPEEPSKHVAVGITDMNCPPQIPSSSTGTLEYPNGTIKRTFAKGYPRTNDITIDELLQSSHVNIAVISSFQWDADWLHEKLCPTRVKHYWIMNAKEKDVQARWQQELDDSKVPNSKIHFPPMHGMAHCMHSKFLLLFAKNKLRFAVPTANMTRTDWGEVPNDWQPGVMENTVFLIDLPRLENGTLGDRNKLTKFGKELVYYLEQQKVARNIVDGVLRFDFSQTDHLAFVHSICNMDKTEEAHPTGLPGLAKVVRDLRLDNVEHLEVDYAASSLGAIDDGLLLRTHLAACGVDFNVETQPRSVRDDFRIYFPTKDTVKKSFGGRDCAGIISLSWTHYNAPTFPKECLRDYDSTRRGMLSHNKLLFARGCKSDGRPVAWVYVGSANLSESAWGGQKVLKSGKLGSLNIRNWECGVVMSVPEETLAASLQDGEIPAMTVFEGIVEVPFHHPGTRYGQRQPWFYRPA